MRKGVEGQPLCSGCVPASQEPVNLLPPLSSAPPPPDIIRTHV